MALSEDDRDLASQPKRLRWFQFRLRTLFMLVTAIIGLLVAYRTYIEPYQAQQAPRWTAAASSAVAPA